MTTKIIHLPGSSREELLAEAFRLTARANVILDTIGFAEDTELHELIALIDERFVSGNAVPVERASIRSTEWDRLRAYLLCALNRGCPAPAGEDANS